jgi:hypothetical protein
MKKPAKQLRLCLAVSVTRMGAWGSGRSCETNALNERRRAGFVMANSAFDARAPEQELRRQLDIAELAGNSGIVKVWP